LWKILVMLVLEARVARNRVFGENTLLQPTIQVKNPVS